MTEWEMVKTRAACRLLDYLSSEEYRDFLRNLSNEELQRGDISMFDEEENGDLFRKALASRRAMDNQFLLDTFAAAALNSGVIASASTHTSLGREALARQAYDIAESMLEERELRRERFLLEQDT